MYNTGLSQDGFCLLYYTRDRDKTDSKTYTFPHNVIPYCLRPSEENILTTNFNVHTTIHSYFTFDELREKNISSQQLLFWSAPIDLAEHYQNFLNTIVNSSSTDNELLFYNCTSLWFGPFCRFTFDPLPDISFKQIVDRTFDYKRDKDNSIHTTCYQHFHCQTSLTCLDWREICDRKIDCLDGSDELYCWQLDINECAQNEFRCHNGQCIPEEFFHDNAYNPDCLDGTDERYAVTDSMICWRDPSFRCEEYTCPPGIYDFPCGDGMCAVGMLDCFCQNGRTCRLLHDPCSMVMNCLLGISEQVNDDPCEKISCNKTNCLKDNCPSIFEFPPGPILFGHIRFIFRNNRSTVNSNTIYLPDYICYNEELCADLFPVTVHLNNWTCRHFHELEPHSTFSFEEFGDLLTYVKNRFRACLVVPNETHYCNHSTMYQYCPFNDDEIFNQSCSLNDARHRYTCSMGENRKCYALLTLGDIKGDCYITKHRYVEYAVQENQNHIYFQTICDGKRDLTEILIDGRYESDETQCEHWPCNNTYTRCDGFWSCKNGADEVNCPPSTCPMFEHRCIFPNDTSKLSCLPISRAGDGIIDCFGASDEPDRCQQVRPATLGQLFLCSNTTKCFRSVYFCDDVTQCPLGDDEKVCTINGSRVDVVCAIKLYPRTEFYDFVCNSFNTHQRKKTYFKPDNMLIYSSQFTTHITSFIPTTPQAKTELIQADPMMINRSSEKWWWQCNRGIPIYIWMNTDTTKMYCLCPPSYYGDQCQYQNQRVSLTFQIEAKLVWRSVFTFIVTLIDNEGLIEAHDDFEYLSIRDCNTKFNVYLLYSTRPKNSSKTYSVQIHTFDKMTVKYRASWIYSLQFPFLPVHRLGILLKIPVVDARPSQTCTLPCIHGQCFNYVNDQNSTFCRCAPGWSGPRCNIEHKCDCASDSLCIGDSMCVCPLGKFGPRCHLLQFSCRSKLCINHGLCIPYDERHSSVYASKFTCICPKGYSGDFCEQQQTRIDISFHSSLTIPSLLLVHLIEAPNDDEYTRVTLTKKVAYDQNSLWFYTSFSFHIAFAEMFGHYYLIILRKDVIISATISTQVTPSHRCISIHELFNDTLSNQHLLRRIKHYHIPCQDKLDLVCFYDEIHFCLCNLDRHANCFEFDRNVTNDCHTYNSCENEGDCYLDDQKCQASLVCVCRECYYGSRCQFSTKGSTLSLDTIIGYQIRQNTAISGQTTVVKVTIALTTTIFALGLISNILSLLTFRMEKTRDVGCGLYLFTSSLTSMITMFILILKFWLLLTSQMGLITNRLFVHIQCVSIDFLLRLFLSTNDWLTACVAIERAVNVSKGVNFNKAKSRQMAKWMILIVFVFTACTYLHDPIYRYLINDEEEQRTWCVTEYSSSLQIYDWLVNIIHLIGPFLTNCISALVIIFTAARSRSNAQKKDSFKKLLRKQFQQHKHLLIASLILILLAVIRLVVLFLYGCMKSARNPWPYLAGYLLSFVPPMLTFVVYVLPSKMYKDQFDETVRHLWQD